MSNPERLADEVPDSVPDNLTAIYHCFLKSLLLYRLSERIRLVYPPLLLHLSPLYTYLLIIVVMFPLIRFLSHLISISDLVYPVVVCIMQCICPGLNDLESSRRKVKDQGIKRKGPTPVIRPQTWGRWNHEW